MSGTWPLADSGAYSILARDAAVDRISALITRTPAPTGFRAELMSKATRVATDVLVIRSSLFVLVVARSTMPVLPPLHKAAAFVSASIAAVSLVAASADIVVQLSTLNIPGSLMNVLSDEDKAEIADRLEALSDPLGEIMEKALEFLGKIGVLDAERAKLAKHLKDFVDAREAAKRAPTPNEQLLQGLAAIEAGKKFFEELKDQIKKAQKQKEDEDRIKGEQKYRKDQLDKSKPDYENGVDYPNPPANNGPGFDDDGSSIA